MNNLITHFYNFLSLLNSQLKQFHGMIDNRVFTGSVQSLADEQKTRIAVDIYGQTYKMVGTETSTHMRLVASIVDEQDEGNQFA